MTHRLLSGCTHRYVQFFSDFDSLLLRARALVMTCDEVWYLLLKAKQDVCFSFLRKTAMSAKSHLKVGKKQHVGEPQFGRSSSASISAKEAPICMVQSLARSSVPSLHDAVGHVHVYSERFENGIFSKPTQELTRARPLHVTKSNVWC